MFVSLICACLDWVTFFSSGIHGYLCLRTSLELPRRRGACGPRVSGASRAGRDGPPEALLSSRAVIPSPRGCAAGAAGSGRGLLQAGCWRCCPSILGLEKSLTPSLCVGGPCGPAARCGLRSWGRLSQRRRRAGCCAAADRRSGSSGVGSAV